jgi:hypothetical protein
MPKRSAKELDHKRNLRLYAGDWETIERLLGSKRITPTTFIRELVHKAAIRMEAQLSVAEQPVKDIEDDDIRELITSQPGESEIAE